MSGAVGSWLVAGVAHTWWGLSLRAESWPQALAALLLYPALEEWVFRAGLQRWLAQRLGHGHLANALATLAFVTLHLPGHGLGALWVAAPSLVLGELWRRQQNLAACAAVHALFNASLMAVSHGVWFTP